MGVIDPGASGYTRTLGSDGYTVTPGPVEQLSPIPKPPSRFTAVLNSDGYLINPIPVAGTVLPSFTSPPVISGTPQEGVAASFTTGVATGTPTPTITSVYLLAGVPVGSSFTPAPGDAGKLLAVRQTATNIAGSVVSTSMGVVIQAAQGSGTTDTRPRFWYSTAQTYSGSAAASDFAGAIPLDAPGASGAQIGAGGSSNGSKAGSFAVSTDNTRYIWVAILQSAVGSGVTFNDGSGDGGFQGASTAGDYTALPPSVNTSTVTFVHSSGTYTLFRSNYRGGSGVRVATS